MKSFLQYLKESQITEGKQEYLKKYSNEPDVKTVINQFWNIKQRLKTPENDIDWWIKKPYDEFKQFVLNFDISKNKSIRKSDKYVEKAKHYGAILLDILNDYEVWYIPSYEAAVQLGRFYKNVSAKWCISTDNSEYFNYTYNNSEFIFLIHQNPQNCDNKSYIKLAIQFEDGFNFNDNYKIWDLLDNDIQDDQEYLNSELYTIVEQVIQLQNKIPYNREQYIDNSIEKYLNDYEWLKNVLFKDKNLIINNDGSCVTNYTLDYLDDIIDDRNIDIDYIKKILQYEYFDVIEAPDEIDFNNLTGIANAFNKITKPYGITWGTLEEIYNEYNSGDINENIYSWIEENLENNFYNGMGYSSYWSDCYINGTGDEAREDILKQLENELNIFNCKWSDNIKGFIFSCKFTKQELKNIIRFYLKGFKKDPILLKRYNENYDEVDKLELTVPYYGWSDFDEQSMLEAAIDFAKRLVGYITMQKDLDGQMYFYFDQPDNPDNIKD